MGETWQCWRCGADLTDLPRPYGRFSQCPACRADLHVCLMCRHYDSRKAKQCRELAADEIRDKGRANPCEWFQPRPGAHRPAPDLGANPARRDLDALFGNPAGSIPTADASARRALDDLFSGEDCGAADHS